MSEITFRVTHSLSETEKKHLFGWDKDIFGAAGYEHITWLPKTTHILLSVKEQLVSHIGLVKETVVVNGQTIRVAGVGGVVTIGQAHGKGYGSQAMRYAADYFRREMDITFGMLFCFDRLLPFYKQLGWQQITDPVTVGQPQGTIVIPVNTLVLPCSEQAWPAGAVTTESYPW